MEIVETEIVFCIECGVGFRRAVSGSGARRLTCGKDCRDKRKTSYGREAKRRWKELNIIAAEEIKKRDDGMGIMTIQRLRTSKIEKHWHEIVNTVYERYWAKRMEL